MQGLPVSAVMPKISASNAGASAGSSAAAESTEQAEAFGAVLEQQIKGMAAPFRLGPDGLPLAATEDAVKEDAAAAAQQLSYFETGSAPDLRDLVAAAMPVLVGEAQPAVSIAHSADKQSPEKIEAGSAPDLRDPAAAAVPVLVGGAQPFVSSANSAGISLPAADANRKLPDPSNISSRLAVVGDRVSDKPGVMPAAEKGVAAAEFAAGGNLLPRDAAVEPGAKPIAALADTNLPRIAIDSPGAANRPDVPAAMPLPAMSSAVSPAPALAVEPRVGASGWEDALGQKVVWLASQNQQVAELHLNPPSLGPLEVRLTVSNDQATALFVSHHPAVRDAIESAMPRLREMLADSGIMLGNATVSAESFTQQQAFQQGAGQSSRQDTAPFGATGEDAWTVRSVTALPSGGNGLVDTFA